MNRTWGMLSEHICECAMQGNIPVYGEFELTARCNLRCRMCYVCQMNGEQKQKELTAKEWIQLAKEARDAGMLFLLLTGGEVFLRDDFKEIYEALVGMGFILSIYTNGTLITPEIAEWLGRIPPSQIDISLYGASPETYARVCKDASGYAKAIRGVDLLLEQGINVQLRTTIVRGNVNDFHKLSKLAEERGLTLGVVNYISQRREGGGTEPEAERLDPKELAGYEFQINQYFNRSASLLQEGNKVQGMEMFQEDGSFDLQDPFPCTTGKCAFWITWDGRMLPCSLMNELTAYPLVQGFDQAFTQLCRQCKSIPICETCNNCQIQEYCMPCPARLKNETGHYDHPSPYLCQLAQERKRIYEKEMSILEGR